jgi:predicted DNA-binding transcriptional regulator YafY
MARNAEVIRQWQVLRAIDAARNGVPIAKVASAQGVHQRTIRRDIEALSKAGFPLYDDRVAGRIVWKLSAKPFRGLEETGLSVTELCALYFSRSILETLAGAPFRHETERAFMKLERALPVAGRKFLDRFPRILKAKVTGRKKQDEKKVREFLARAVDASLRQRRVLMQYDSISSRRTKAYKVDPLRLSYAERRHLFDRVGRGVWTGANVCRRTDPHVGHPGRTVRTSAARDRALRAVVGGAFRNTGRSRDRIRRESG